MTPEVALMLVLLGAALVLFWGEWLPADVTGLVLMVTLVLSGLLPPREAFAGFGSDVVMMIFGLLVMTAALGRTGVVDLAGRAILRRTGTDPSVVLVVVTAAVAALSAFISNTAATAFFLPVVMGVARRARVSPSRLLLPLAFASILSSSVTLVSTSTNLVISGLMARGGLAPMGMFELAPVGVPIAVAGLLYLWVIGRRLTPERAPPEADDQFGLRPYLTEVLVLPASALVGKTLDEAAFGRELDLVVLRVVRGETYRTPDGRLRLAAGDVLLVEGRREEILRVKDTAGIEIRPDVTLPIEEGDENGLRLAEVLVMPRSVLIGRTLRTARFRERFGLQVLAINRHDEVLRQKLSDVRLRMGDLLLVQGPPDRIAALDAHHLRVLTALADRLLNLQRAPISVAAFIGALALGAFGLAPFPVAMLAGAAVVLATRCLTPEEAYREVEWKVLILVGSMLALGQALERTGAAAFLAAGLVGWFRALDPLWLLAAFFALTVGLTQPMSNQAAAVVVLPVAFQAAVQLDLNPRTFAMMIAVAASCSYLTPLEPSCLLVYGPGRYRFTDFLRVGLLLTVIILALALLLVPRVWPLASGG